MSHSRFRSATSLLVLAPLVAGCGGSDDSCGPGSAPASGLVATVTGATLTFGQLTSGLNNDCPASNPPMGVVSMTIFGTQTGGSGAIALCVSRPDLLASGSQALGPDAPGTQVRIIDLTGDAASCSYAVDDAKAITGTASAKGMCNNGNDPAGFALTLNGALSLTRTCGATVDSVQVTLSGTAAITGNVPF
jgi:hypothetical protein